MTGSGGGGRQLHRRATGFTDWHRKRGFTVLELLATVAILGLLTTLALGELSVIAHQGRARAAARNLLGVLNGARVRAVTTGCAYFVQLNGTAYAGTGPGAFPARPGTLSIVRKASCSPAVPSFEVGDTVVETLLLSPDELPNSARVRVPASLVAAQLLSTQALTVAYDRFGHRSIAVDGSGGGYLGFAPDGTLSTSALPLTAEDSSGAYQDSLTVPLAAPASVP